MDDGLVVDVMVEEVESHDSVDDDLCNGMSTDNRDDDDGERMLLFVIFECIMIIREENVVLHK